ncbi:helix-turn-helix domain-containing protein [Mucisphaera calidilacus]|uniref:Uncharacterized protein n=1 Tax=Mucisphaera calidilacus TaxID=2527982 RepID=A0A518BTU6_9BACT|nr:hypothetical protein [Mucisphaera calidilacus]QDU70384.1 hypothetical protein Pan265_02110 [Mucisphaera calidilacus]
MPHADLDNTIARWSRAGVLFGSRPARATPDLERLLLDTAQLAAENARLFYMAVTWLSRYGNFIARHRLKRLVETELEADYQPVLGAFITLAVKHGASRELLIAAEVCQPADAPYPLFAVQRHSPALTKIAQRNACSEGARWNLWLPDEPPKLDALRPARWIINQNPAYLDRIVRKGDLRCSILLVLRCDTAGGSADSEVALAEKCSANRIAVRNALDDLEREGYTLRQPEPGARNTRIVLAASPAPLAAS